MSSSTLIPVSEYLSTSYRPDRDYIDGVVLERNLGEWDHSWVQKCLIVYFGLREKEWNIVAVAEQRVQVSPTRFRIPDVTVLLRPFKREQIITHPPFLCIEILSKDDTMKQMQERIDDYLQFGVAYIWVIDPRTHRCFSFTPAGMHEATDGILRTSHPDLFLPLSELSERDFD